MAKETPQQGQGTKLKLFTATVLRIAQLLDLLGQLAMFFVAPYLEFGLSDEGLSLSKYYSEAKNIFFNVLFLLGGWQLLSALLHLIAWNRIVRYKSERRWHLGVTVLLGPLAFLISVPFLFFLLVLTPIMGVSYFIITALELWHLSPSLIAQQCKKIVSLKIERYTDIIVAQALCLIFILISHFFRSGNILEVFFSWSYYTVPFILGFAGWLLIGYIKARRAGQLSRLETIGLLWTIGSLCFSLYLAFFHVSLDFRFEYAWALLPLSPIWALSIWYAARVWRGPLLPS